MKSFIALALLLLSVSIFAADHPTGLVIPLNWQKDAKFLSPTELLLDEVLPKHFDWKEEGIMTAVKNQGSCGSCWAFGTTGVLEALHKKKSGKELDLSEQELVSCFHENSYGCSGGWFAFNYQVKPGQSLESEFPYRASNLSCRKNLSHEVKAVTWNFVGAKGENPTVEEIKAAVYKYGPAAVTVAADGNWQNYRGGVLKSCNNRQLNHLVIITGWDEDGKYWIVKNSWGEQWGEKGYLRIKYNCDGIGQLTAVAQID